MAEQEGHIIGYAYVSIFHERKAYDWAVETSIYVDKDYKRSGCGKLLYQALEKILKKQHISNLYACIAYTEHEDEHLTNDSMHFHEHLGYELVGTFKKCGYKFNRWYDMIWMEKMIGGTSGESGSIYSFRRWMSGRYLNLFYKKSAKKPMVFRPWDEWRHELSIYILLKTLHFSKICAMIYIQENPFPSQ